MKLRNDIMAILTTIVLIVTCTHERRVIYFYPSQGKIVADDESIISKVWIYGDNGKLQTVSNPELNETSTYYISSLLTDQSSSFNVSTLDRNNRENKFDFHITLNYGKGHENKIVVKSELLLP